MTSEVFENRIAGLFVGISMSILGTGIVYLVDNKAISKEIGYFIVFTVPIVMTYTLLTV